MKWITILFSLFLFSCTQKGGLESSDSLKISLKANISTLDPALSFDSVSASILYQCYETLYEYHYSNRPYELRPLLAASDLKITNEGKTYTIKLKKGVLYHDDPAFGGMPRHVKAQDFVNQIKRLAFLPLKSNGWWIFENKIQGLDEFRKKVGNDFNLLKTLRVEGLQTPDDHTLVIHLKRPYQQFKYALAMTFVTPIPMEVLDYYRNDLNGVLVGTGPFKLKHWNPLSGSKLIKFSNYHDKANNNTSFKDINFTVIKESLPRLLNFRKKKLDLLVIPNEQFSEILDKNGELHPELKKEGVKLQVAPTLTLWWLSFNMRDSLLGKNRNLRLAIAHAIDREKMVELFTQKTGQLANSIFPPGILGHNPNNRLPYTYNLELAKEYLKKAGYPNGRGLPTINFDTRGTNQKSRKMAEFIKRSLEKVNIYLKIEINSFPAFLEKSRVGKLQFWQDGWAMDYPDPENILQLLYSKNLPPGPNATYFGNQSFDNSFHQFNSTFNKDKKVKELVNMEQTIHEELPWILQYYSRNYIVIQPHLKNYRYSPLVTNYVKYLQQ